VQKNHPEKLILDDKNDKNRTRRKMASSFEQVNLSLLSKIEPKCFVEANNDQHWVNTMEEELN
jgi:hypothetical protein